MFSPAESILSQIAPLRTVNEALPVCFEKALVSSDWQEKRRNNKSGGTNGPTGSSCLSPGFVCLRHNTLNYIRSLCALRKLIQPQARCKGRLLFSALFLLPLFNAHVRALYVTPRVLKASWKRTWTGGWRHFSVLFHAASSCLLLYCWRITSLAVVAWESLCEIISWLYLLERKAGISYGQKMPDLFAYQTQNPCKQ